MFFFCDLEWPRTVQFCHCVRICRLYSACYEKVQVCNLQKQMCSWYLHNASTYKKIRSPHIMCSSVLCLFDKKRFFLVPSKIREIFEVIKVIAPRRIREGRSSCQHGPLCVCVWACVRKRRTISVSVRWCETWNGPGASSGNTGIYFHMFCNYKSFVCVCVHADDAPSSGKTLRLVFYRCWSAVTCFEQYLPKLF